VPVISVFFGIVIRMFYRLKAGKPLERIAPLE
jgi:hypothetical protein